MAASAPHDPAQDEEYVDPQISANKPVQVKLGDKVLRSYQVTAMKGALKIEREGGKGLLLAMGMGTGKTMTSIACAQALLEGIAKVKNVVVSAPAAVTVQFRGVISKNASHPSKWSVASYDMFKPGKKAPAVGSGTVLIIDEAHNLRNMSNARSKAVLRAANRAHFTIALTGTPMVNGLHDLAVLHKLVGVDIKRTFPRSKKDVEEHFPFNVVDDKVHFEGQNPCNMVRQAFGGRTLFYYPENADGFPTRYSEQVTVPLTAKQVRLMKQVAQNYKGAESALKELDAMVLKMLAPKSGRASSGASTASSDSKSSEEGGGSKNLNAFLTRTRQLANKADKEGGCSAKIKTVVDTIRSGAGPAIVFSNFKEEGVELIRRCGNKGKGKKKMNVVIYDGSLTQKKRQAIVNDYNSGKIDVMAFTRAGAEGVDLKGVRQVHILEPQWNDAITKQAEARAVRYLSHKHLKKEDRKVHIFHYVSKPKNPKAHKAAFVEERLLDIQRGKRVLIHAINQALADAGANLGEGVDDNPKREVNIDLMDTEETIEFLIDEGELHREGEKTRQALMEEAEQHGGMLSRSVPRGAKLAATEKIRKEIEDEAKKIAKKAEQAQQRDIKVVSKRNQGTLKVPVTSDKPITTLAKLMKEQKAVQPKKAKKTPKKDIWDLTILEFVKAFLKAEEKKSGGKKGRKAAEGKGGRGTKDLGDLPIREYVKAMRKSPKKKKAPARRSKAKRSSSRSRSRDEDLEDLPIREFVERVEKKLRQDDKIKPPPIRKGWKKIERPRVHLGSIFF